jgi:glycerophosphoryl diester phosphodiesterase
MGMKTLFLIGVTSGQFTAQAASNVQQFASLHPDRPVVIAHRGASAIAPENTLAAIQAAAELGAVAVEFDLHASKDGGLVVMHDSTLARTTNGRGRVAHRTVQELQQLDAGSWFSPDFASEVVPTLFEALENVGTTMIACIEVKTPAVSMAKIVDAVSRAEQMDNVVIFSFSPKQVSAAKRAMPSVPALLLVDIEPWNRYSTTDLIAKAKESQADLLGLDHKGVTAPLVEGLHQSGIPVFVYTVDSDAEVKRMVDIGVDGIISNRPRATLSRVYRHRPRSKPMKESK